LWPSQSTVGEGLLDGERFFTLGAYRGAECVGEALGERTGFDDFTA
jgi:hypothetical protein